MASSAAQLAKRIGEVATAVQRGQRTSVTDAALFAKDEMNAGLKRVGVRPGGKSARSGLKLPRATFNLRGFQNPTALVRYLGPVHWWEGGVRPHPIAPKSWGGSRNARAVAVLSGNPKVAKESPRAVRTPFGPRAYVRRARGMKARPFWKGTKARITKGAPEVLRSGMVRNIAESAFGK